jgi:hypothetical protein
MRADQPLAVLLDAARAPPRRHVAAQLIGLAGRVVGGDHRQPHHLLLEQRHAQRLGQHRLEAGVRVDHLLLAAAPPQVRVDHAAGDRAGPHDADLDHQIVEVRGRSRGSIDICARLSIWNTPTVSAAHIMS